MAAYVAGILQSKVAVEKTSLDTLIANLSHQIGEQKAALKDKLEPRYQVFQRCYVNLEDLHASLTSAVPEAENVEKEVLDHVMPRLRRAACDIRELSKELEVAEEQCVEVSKYVHVHKCFENAEEAFGAEDFEVCSKHLQEAGDVIKTLHGDKSGVGIVGAIQCEHVVRCERLRYKLSEVWKQHIVWKIGRTPHVVVLIVQRTDNLGSLLRALEEQNELKDKISQFASFLLTNIVEPMVKYGSEVTVEKNSSTLQVNFVEDRAPAVLDVLSNLLKVFAFLEETLAGLVVEERTLLQMVGEAAGSKLTDVVVKYCLEPAVPSEGSQLVEFPSDVLLNLHERLVKMRFLSSETSQFSSFATSLESLSLNKRNRNILLRAREMMKLPLHDTVIVGEVGAVVEKRKFTASPDDSLLHESVFRFPKARVSKWVVEIIDLLKPMVNEALEPGVRQSWHLEAVRNVCELYCGVVPVVHRHAIEDIPLQNAIHHNNCMYLAHSLLELGASGIPMADLVSKLRRLGAEPFLKQMRRQTEHLTEFLQEIPTYEDGGSLERAVQRCLFHLQQLKSAWSDVLPKSVYLNAIGTLLNSVVDRIVDDVVGTEDIPATLSEDLVTTFDGVITRATKLFDLPDGTQDERALATRHVQSWKKFCELKQMLGFNLREVVDRWADGKGPLAACFAPEEVKKLIRALFQNTDRRAAALAKIR